MYIALEKMISVVRFTQYIVHCTLYSVQIEIVKIARIYIARDVRRTLYGFDCYTRIYW